MHGETDHRYTWRLGLVALACVVGVAAAASATPRSSLLANLLGDEIPVPDDTVLREQMEDAIDLRRREDFDRFLDARDPGELAEHATLYQVQLEGSSLGVDALFIVGDELFGYLFRPENGWGSGGADRAAPGYTPRLQRLHRGAAGGPDAFGCFSCHSKGGPDGAGMQTQNAFMRGDGARLTGADQRNPPHLLGLGPVAALAREMSAELESQAADAAARAREAQHQIEAELRSKGVSFGRVVATADGNIDYVGVEGVDHDLTIRPFGWKGHQATLRGMIEESLHIHQGLLSMRLQKAVRDGLLDPGPYGSGELWFDLDGDGINIDVDSGMLTTVVAYLAQLETPIVRPPRDPELLDAFAAGHALFEESGCAGCHVPTLELADPNLPVPHEDIEMDGPGPRFIVHLATDGDLPKIEPRYAGTRTSYFVHLFSDLKRHDMGEALASPAAQGSIPARVFLTRSLWGLAETAPYLHDGRAPTVHDAIRLHGGEAAAARDAYLALDEHGRAAVRVFLTSLSRQPKVFLP